MAGDEPPASSAPDTPPSRAQRLLADDQAPASVAQFKGLRRWLVVAGVWAVAATALAVFALIQATDEDEAGREQAAGEIGRVERQLNDRIDELEGQLQDLPTADDVSALDTRLGQVENGAERTSGRLEELTGRVDDLERQVNDLEEQLAEDPPPTETNP